MTKHPLIVFKVSTDYFESPKGQIVIKKTIKQMHRMSEGTWRPIEDELSNDSAKAIALDYMTGIGDLSDGLYQLKAHYSFSGIYQDEVDEVCYSFLPFDKTTQPNALAGEINHE